MVNPIPLPLLQILAKTWTQIDAVVKHPITTTRILVKLWFGVKEYFQAKYSNIILCNPDPGSLNGVIIHFLAEVIKCYLNLECMEPFES